MDPKTRSLIELLRDETQSRSVYARCNEVLAAMPFAVEMTHCGGFIESGPVKTVTGVSYWNSEAGYITATEAEVQIITGERK